ncbi:type II toxin-antitoxin system VapC family toxin [Bernardetia sp. MNP-M8]|uniref:type II toxin-antitoxin system VapC family toxin n=1 Tax=Bernardetia sp. MNP-M8 TaxID=3127470 RepID=UPI0030CC78DB
MKKYLLDTNICIYYLKKQFDLDKKIIEVGFKNCYVSEITLAELLFGVENGEEQHKERNQNKYNEFEELFEKRIIPIREAFEHYAIQRAKLRKTGKQIGDFDTLIASTALVHEMILVTRNVKHFERIEGLEIENWIDVD